MNERIYELATEAGAYCETYLYGGDTKPPVLEGMDLEKFAELIIIECAIVINKSAGPFTTGPGYLLLEHFGVE